MESKFSTLEGDLLFLNDQLKVEHNRSTKGFLVLLTSFFAIWTVFKCISYVEQGGATELFFAIFLSFGVVVLASRLYSMFSNCLLYYDEVKVVRIREQSILKRIRVTIVLGSGGAKVVYLAPNRYCVAEVIRLLKIKGVDVDVKVVSLKY